MSHALSPSGAVVFRRTGGPDAVDAIDAHSRHLVAALGAVNVAARYFPDGPSTVLAAGEPPWVLLQYNPFRYGRAGFAPMLVRDVVRLRRRSAARLALMVHEAWIDMTDPKSGLIGLWQRAQLRALLALADRVLASTDALCHELGHDSVHLPVATLVDPGARSRKSAREQLGLDSRLVVTLLGTGHPSRALEHAEAAIGALAQASDPNLLIVQNLGDGAPNLRVPGGIEVFTPGWLDEETLSVRLAASDLVLLPFHDGLSTRRSTMMAALAHGAPVLGLYGPRTDPVLLSARDALALTPVGDVDAFARAAVQLIADLAALHALGERGRELYRSRFDWPVLARAVASVLADV